MRRIKFNVEGDNPQDIDDLGELLMDALTDRNAIDPVVEADRRHMEVEWHGSIEDGSWYWPSDRHDLEQEALAQEAASDDPDQD